MKRCGVMKREGNRVADMEEGDGMERIGWDGMGGMGCSAAQWADGGCASGYAL